MPFPLLGEFKGRCRQYLGAAKIAWGRLTGDEGLKTEGRADRLAGLEQEKDALDRDDAAKRPRLPRKRKQARLAA